MSKKKLVIIKIFVYFTFLIFVLSLLNKSTIDWLYQSPSFAAISLFKVLAFGLALIVLCSFFGLSCFLRKARLFKIIQNSEFGFISTLFWGISLAGLLVYLLGFLNLLYSWIFIVVVLLGFAGFVINFNQKIDFRWIKHRWDNIPIQEKAAWVICCLILLFRLVPVLQYNSFGDPLYYNIPSGRDYLSNNGFKWLEYEEFYFQAGFFDLILIYLHSFAKNPLFVEITAQAFFFLLGPVLFFYVLYFKFFYKIIPQHSAWLSLSFIVMSSFRLESIIAKPDYLQLVVLSILISIIYSQIQIINSTKKVSTADAYWPKQFNENWNLILLLAALLLSTKTTSIFFLAPLSLAMMVIFRKNLPFIIRQVSIIYIAFIFFLSLINYIKNYLIFKNPLFPFANTIFNSPYWDELASERMKGLFNVNGTDLYSYLFQLPKFFTPNFTSLLIIGLIAIWVLSRVIKLPGLTSFKERPSTVDSDNISVLLVLLILSWFGSIIIWILALSAYVFFRFIIGLIFFSCLIPIMFGVRLSNLLNLQQHQKLLQRIGIASIVLSLSISNVNIDLRGVRGFFSGKSLEQQWQENSDFTRLQNYLNSITDKKSKVLFHTENQRLFANYTVYGARYQSPLTRFVFERDIEEIRKGIDYIKPNYYVIEIKKLQSNGGLMENKEFLLSHTNFIKEISGYLVFQIKEWNG